MVACFEECKQYHSLGTCVVSPLGQHPSRTLYDITKMQTIYGSNRVHHKKNFGHWAIYRYISHG